MNPDWLPPLVLFEHYGGGWEKYEIALYSFFRKDFVDRKMTYKGTELSLKRHPLINGKEATYWHLISEGKEETERIPDLRRCERIRWPRAVIEHSEYGKIKIWENMRKGEVRICLWAEEAEYLVILAKRKGYILLWTAYPVTQEHRKRKLRREYEDYLKAGGAP